MSSSSPSSEDKKSPKCEQGKNGKHNCVEHTREVQDFYVNRLLDSTTKRYKIVAEHKRTDDKDLNTTEIDYTIQRYQKDPEKYRNGSTVRIPAMFWFRKFDPAQLNDLIVSKGKYKGDKAVVKKQWGSHIFLSNGAEMQTLNCFLNEKHEYSAEKPSNINCVYPVLRNYTKRDDKPELVLGSRYSSKTDTKGDRSFGIDLDPKDNASGVWDITEDFIDSSSQSLNYSKDEFSCIRRRYALYVCEDSRLIVTDDRGSTKTGEKITTSLYQQGSLIVIEVEKGNELMLGPEFYTREKKPKSREDITEETKDELVPCLCKWQNLGRKGFLDKRWFNGSIEKEEENDKTTEKTSSIEGEVKDGEKLSERRRVVIFLGVAESHHNTACWRLELTSTGEKEYILRPPDGGRIIDIQGWDKGFEQITARHKYQRLFEAVLFPDIHAKLTFSVPEEKLLKRILGIPDTDSSLNPIIIVDTSKHFKKNKHKEYQKPEVKGSHRMSYVEGVFKRQNWTAPNQYCVQPLNPPIAQLENNENHFLYLKYGAHPVLSKDRHYKINGKEYETFVKEIPEYSWKLLGRVSDFKDGILTQHSKQNRIGVDWMVYETKFEQVGFVNSVIFYPKKESVTPVKSTPLNGNL